jgi:hypothetical protein
LAPDLSSGDERSGSERRLHDEAAAREAADQPVAAREVLAGRRGAKRKLREQQAARANIGGQGRVARGVEHVDARAEDRDGGPGAGEPAAVRGGVDAERQP